MIPDDDAGRPRKPGHAPGRETPCSPFIFLQAERKRRGCEGEASTLASTANVGKLTSAEQDGRLCERDPLSFS